MRPDLDRTLAALSDPGRRAIVELLRGGPRRPSEVADALAMSRPSLSRHVRVLRTAGLVEEESLEDDARAHLVRLRRAPFRQLGAWVGEVEAFWDEKLEGFKAHAEKRHRERER